MRDPEKTKDAIFAAAEQLISEKGVSALTLDDVAARASISKGGLLHHFPNKQSLITGLGKRMIDQHEEEIDELMRQDPAAPGAYTRAYLRASMACGDECTRICTAMTTESRCYPDLLALFREYSQQCDARIAADGLDPATGLAVRYAAEGLSAMSMWGMPRPANYNDVIQRLLTLSGHRAQ